MGIGPPDMTGVVASYSTPGTRRRFAVATTNADGYRVDGAVTDTVSQGHIFPANGDTATRFELQDIAGLYEVHAEIELLPAAKDGSREADRWIATVAGSTRVLEVVASAPWIERPAGTATWFAAVLQEVDT